MTNSVQSKRLLLFRLLTCTGLVLLVVSFFTPMWWVSLKAPNYPEAVFPDGVKIDIHFNGVFNGCKIRENQEVEEDEALDCVHEMNTINHYIGMEPIEVGAQTEIKISPYLFIGFSLALVVMLFYAGPGWWILGLPAILLPAAFVIDFSAWLWWFGHHLREWAAFTVKPFMPTVLGVGKVAQFHTYAYPHIGMAISTASAFCILLAVLIRRKQLAEHTSEE